MGGEITVESEYSIGSTFIIRIPQAIESEEPVSSVKDSTNNSMSSAAHGSSIAGFTIPQARLLIVDDFPTNLKVAQGLLSPYKAIVDTCLTGEEAVKLIKQNDYDIVFMDHMMPDMDGIEATALVRNWENEQLSSAANGKKLPVIALTANAMIGMREMFMEKGFNDFLTKPIDVFKLNEIIDRWIPHEMKLILNSENTGAYSSSTSRGAEGYSFINTNSSLFNISGLDVKSGLIITQNTVDGYCNLLSIFCKDTEARLPLLQTAQSADTLSAFITNIHAIKSASAFIGANELSKKALKLEELGKAGDTSFINDCLSGFTDYLINLLKSIHEAIDDNS